MLYSLASLGGSLKISHRLLLDWSLPSLRFNRVEISNSRKLPNMSAPPRRCWVGNAASSVCAVGQRTHPAEVQSEPHLPSDVVLGQLVTERIGLENGIVLSFSS